MKKFRLIGVILSAVMLAACSGNSAEQEVTETVSESTVTTSETTAAATAETTTETTTETEAEEVTETTFVCAFEPAEEYVQVSPDTEFIDYEFIEDYQGTTDIGELADKAVEFLKTTKFYESSMENISEFTDEKLAPYIEDGVIVPKFNTAYPNDYDGDGKTETFIEVDMPHCGTSIGELRRYYIFADSGGNMSVVHDSPVWLLYSDMKLLDYGRVKQIILGGDGTAGAESGNAIYGVQNGQCVRLYGGRCRYYKNDCFLYTTGWQGSGDFMYFDINEGKYFTIGGEDVPLEKIKEMDKDGVLSEFYDWYDENNYLIIKLIGKKYYVFSISPMDIGGTAYIYENGKFIQDEKCSYVRISEGIWGEKDRGIDIEQALANMKPVQK